MFEQFISLVTSQLGNHLQQDSNIAGQNLDMGQVTQTAGQSIFDTISDQISNGNLQGITEMFSGKQTDASSPVVNDLSNNMVSQFQDKINLSPQTATMIAAVAVPFILNLFNKQTSEAQQSNGFDISSILSSVMGGGNQNTSGGGGLLGGLLGSVLSGGNANAGGGMGSQVLGSVLSSFLK